MPNPITHEAPTVEDSRLPLVRRTVRSELGTTSPPAPTRSSRGCCGPAAAACFRLSAASRGFSTTRSSSFPASPARIRPTFRNRPVARPPSLASTRPSTGRATASAISGPCSPRWPSISATTFSSTSRRSTRRSFKGKIGLDLGCGFGRHVYNSAQFGAEMVGVDLSEAIESTRAEHAGSAERSPGPGRRLSPAVPAGRLRFRLQHRRAAPSARSGTRRFNVSSPLVKPRGFAVHLGVQQEPPRSRTSCSSRRAP